jgi:nicotinamide-nucleotide amidase
MDVRAGIVVTGTEVLGGLVADRNGPWLSERLRERGVQVGHILVCGDRPDDVRSALEFLARDGVALAITSGGLGPTADDLTAEVVAGFAGRPLVFDAPLEERIWAIVSGLRRLGHFDEATMREGSRKQALVPEGATVLEPVGTAPGLVVPPRAGDGPLVLVLPGPPGELQTMWEAAVATEAVEAVLAGAGRYEQRMLRLLGVPEPVIAATLRELEADGMPLGSLEITTCLRRGELEVATVFAPEAEPDYAAFAAAIRARHGDALFSDDGSTVDDQVAELLAGRTVAVAESCTGGLMSARLTERAGSSAYVLGGAVVYANEAKVELAGVPAELIERHGAVSPEVAVALADGARARFGAEYGIGITGIAGPGGGTPEKPVGTVCVSVAGPAGREERLVRLPGGRSHIRDRTTTVAMHMLRRLLLAA